MARAGLRVDRCGRRDLRVHARRGQRYDYRMTTSTTMRLVGLLVIVGMVAGCGSASRGAADDLTTGDRAAPEVEAILAECVEIGEEAERQHDEQHHEALVRARDRPWRYRPPDSRCERARGLAGMALACAESAGDLLKRGEYEGFEILTRRAREHLAEARIELNAARRARTRE